MQNDKILTINGKPPRTVDDAINLIKSAGCHIKFMILRALWIDDDVPIDRSTPMSTPIFIEKLAYHTTNVAPEKPARSLSTSPKSHASSMASFGSNWVSLIFKLILSKLFFSKDNQMRSPSLLSGPKIRKAYFKNVTS